MATGATATDAGGERGVGSSTRFGLVVLTYMLASALGCGATATTEDTGEYVDDSVITAKVKAAIFAMRDSTSRRWSQDITKFEWKVILEYMGASPGNRGRTETDGEGVAMTALLLAPILVVLI